MTASSPNPSGSPSPKPLVVAIEMGYGHLRAAWPLADALGIDVLEVDRPPLARVQEKELWKRTRQVYESICRVSQWPALGGPLRQFLDDATSIPHLHPSRDLSAPNAATRAIDLLAARVGLGKGLVETLRSTGSPLLTTFFAPALIAERQGVANVYCVVTDSDINRIWAPLNASSSRIIYLAPSTRVVRRLRAYGVPADCIRLTGFPLPGELLGGPELPILKRNLAARLMRLDPQRMFEAQYGDEIDRLIGKRPQDERGKSPLITFAVGGAGAQTEIVEQMLPSLRSALEQGRMRLALVAGVRPEVARHFEQWIREQSLAPLLGGAIRILFEPDMRKYFKAFNALMAETDVLWTKPSEMTFFGALGLPLVLAPPVGAHERYNGRWAVEHGAGLYQRDPRHAGEWLVEWLADGALAGAAWAGFKALPKYGLYKVLEEVGRPLTAPA
ncbi:MAG: hypothetical protein HY898_16110 [Deltaproteobacteria bacterium]|nr:hypothetical protein [Deltaproteobacteria bacterium]